MEETLGWEKELLGLYISGHPLEKFREKLSSTGVSIAPNGKSYAKVQVLP